MSVELSFNLTIIEAMVPRLQKQLSAAFAGAAHLILIWWDPSETLGSLFGKWCF